MSERDDREPVDADELANAHVDLKRRIHHSFRKHGSGKFVNAFEVLGVLQLEFDEFKAEIQKRGSFQRQYDELLDVACVAIIAAASIGKKKDEGNYVTTPDIEVSITKKFVCDECGCASIRDVESSDSYCLNGRCPSHNKEVSSE